MLFIYTAVSSTLPFPYVCLCMYACCVYLCCHMHSCMCVSATSGGAGYAAATSRESPQMGPTRKCSLHAQALPTFLGHSASSRVWVLEAQSGFSTSTHPTRTAFMIDPIPVSDTKDIPRSSSVAFSCDRYCMWCFTALVVASLPFFSAKSLIRSCTCGL